MQILILPSGAGSKMLHFQQAPRWYQRSQSTNYTVGGKNLEQKLTNCGQDIQSGLWPVFLHLVR